MRLIFTLVLIFAFAGISAQSLSDSTRILQEVVIEAYETDRSLNEVPASVGVLNAENFQRFNNTSFLPAVNIVPGVRMEERSPGSYRFSIRGSSLRSPFGVRNVKAYWNGLPFTDGGGNTYLNLLDFNTVGSMEIIKGPGGSLYGAGTGGVILLKSPEIEQNKFQATATAGSYGLQRYLISGQTRTERIQANAQLALHRADGYRDQTELKRLAFNADLKLLAGTKGTLTGTLLYSDLSYGTPGGLTLAESESNPRLARPPTALPGAVEARAAVTNKTVYGGVIYDYGWNAQWTTTTGVYGAFSAFENPTIRNYEDRDETNYGARSTTEYSFARTNNNNRQKITFGGEYQHSKSPIAVYDNDGQGNPADLQVRDEVSSDLGLFFAQADLHLPGNIFVTAGASVNFLKYNFIRMEPAPSLEQERNFDPVLSPRLAVLKKFSDNASIFASYSDGFSPPSLAEVRPSTNTFSRSLKAESGNNLEMGVRGNFFDRVHYDIVVYEFGLRNTIVVQRNEEGADYFVNAGKTLQRGLEAFVAYDLQEKDNAVSPLKVWASYAHQYYRFRKYAPLDQDYSGNALTGIAPTTVSAGVDAIFLGNFSTHLTLNYVDEIPLNDANTAFADAYMLLGLRAGWHTSFQRSNRLELFAGVDNALDERYSLGNDLNAFGGRYYNPAMPRNYYAGLSIVLASD